MYNRNNKGNLIAFEGIDGSGKSEQIKLLEKELIRKGIDYHLTKEPTDGSVGTMIREKYLSGKEVVDDKVLALLFAADRMDHITNPDNGILKYINDGINVISDRCFLSSLVYDGLNKQILNMTYNINDLNIKLASPKLIVYLDVDPSVAISRIHRSRDKKDIYETLDTLTNLHNSYKQIIDSLRLTGQVIATIDANTDEETVFKMVSKIVIANLHRRYIK